MALVCDHTEVQPRLRHTIIGNEGTFLVKSLASLKGAAPPNVHLLRQKSAWNNGSTMAAIIRRLGEDLRPFADAFQAVLLMDAIRLHTTKEVLDACRAAKVWPLLVPAKLTWLLQPLDTDAFGPYKRHLRKAFQSARAVCAGGDLTMQEFLPCVYGAVRHVLQGTSWAHTFEQNGFGCDQSNVAAHVRRHLHIDTPLCIPAVCPTPSQLECCFPKRTRVPTAALWRVFDHTPAAAAASSSSSALRGPSTPAVPAAREPRTRAEHRRASVSVDVARVVPVPLVRGASRAVARAVSDIPTLD